MPWSGDLRNGLHVLLFVGKEVYIYYFCYCCTLALEYKTTEGYYLGHAQYHILLESNAYCSANSTNHWYSQADPCLIVPCSLHFLKRSTACKLPINVYFPQFKMVELISLHRPCMTVHIAPRNIMNYHNDTRISATC